MIVKTTLLSPDVLGILKDLGLDWSWGKKDAHVGRRDKLWHYALNLHVNEFTKKYQRRGMFVSPKSKSGKAKRVAAVCFHGYYDFAERLFGLDPRARIESVMTKRALGHDLTNTEGNWEYEAEQIAQTNVGSLMEPRDYGDDALCTCAEPREPIDEFAWRKDPIELIHWLVDRPDRVFMADPDLADCLPTIEKINEAWRDFGTRLGAS